MLNHIRFGIMMCALGFSPIALVACHTVETNSGNNARQQVNQGANVPDAELPVSVFGGTATAEGTKDAPAQK